MNSSDLLKNMGNIDEKYWQEADPEAAGALSEVGKERVVREKRKRLYSWAGALAAVFVLAAGINFWMHRDPNRIPSETESLNETAGASDPGRAGETTGEDPKITEPHVSSAESSTETAEQAQAKIVWYSDEQLLERADLIVVASILRWESGMDGRGAKGTAANQVTLTLHPIRLVKGEWEEGKELTAVMTEYPENSSVAGMNFILPGMKNWRSVFPDGVKPQEGIFLLTKLPAARQTDGIAYELHTGYGAILETHEGTAHVQGFFTEYPESLTLTQAEKKIRQVLGSAAVPVPKDDPEKILLRSGDVVIGTKGAFPFLGSGGVQMSSEACLAFLTEHQLFSEASLVVRAKVTEIKDIEIYNERWGRSNGYRLFTLEPLSVIRGERKSDGPIRVLMNIESEGSSLHGLDKAFRGVQLGAEGILMLHEFGEGTPSYFSELADYTVGDNERFAIWAQAGELMMSGDAFPSFGKDTTLDQAEAHIRRLLDAELPADFSFSIDYAYCGMEEYEDRAFSYESETGSYRRSHWTSIDYEPGSWQAGQPRYRQEETSGSQLILPKEVMKELYLQCLSLEDLSDEYQGSAGSGRTSFEISLHFSYGDRDRTIRYRGSELGYMSGLDPQLRKLAGAVFAIQNLIWNRLP
ncbi:MAG: hypothetical protein J5496_03505 [Lachnospiraceae bacterium]|nr:hypothetical protein [Lachnospiraceae bacterium]